MDHIAFGDLVLNGDNAVGQTGAIYTVTRAEGLAGPPRPRVSIARKSNQPGALLCEATDDFRIVVLEGEIHAPTHELLEEELARFRRYVNARLGEQWLVWTPQGQETRRIRAVPQNDGALTLDVDDDTTARFRLELLCPDPQWRAATQTVDTWDITASGQTRTVVNDGTDETYPILEITPTSVKTGGYAYKRYVLVTWRAPGAETRYPIRIGPLDTAELIGAGKMQADGDDLRIFVDGQEVDRWLVGINTTSTYIWFNADWQAAQYATLSTSITTGDVDSIEVNEDISGFPSSGVLLIDGEAFSYTSKSDADRKFTGITRAVWGTSEAAHSTGATVWWMQHEVVIAYGNASVGAPSVDDRYKPAFDLTVSTNTSWHYTEFGDSDELRAARWHRWGNLTTAGNGGCYSATQGSLASPYTVAGAWLSKLQGNAFGWYLKNACGIVNAAWADGLKRAREDTSDFLVHLMYWVRGDTWWTWQATISNPTAVNTWEAWSEPAAASDWDEAETMAIAAYFHAQDVEVGTVTVTLSSTDTPAVSIGPEQGNYSLRAKITNETTGEAIEISFDMSLNETLEVDTEAKTVTHLADGTNQFQAVSLVGGVRRHWLRLVSGQNTLRFEDDGTSSVTVTTKFYARYY
ncbi:MAG TPA: hypothetical protein EYH32_00385 [Anaerolineae bacterium]|nr:hypothetical protein [Anaerolineae bacterium]